MLPFLPALLLLLMHGAPAGAPGWESASADRLFRLVQHAVRSAEAPSEAIEAAAAALPTESVASPAAFGTSPTRTALGLQSDVLVDGASPRDGPRAG